MKVELEGKVAIVTGGANGIGRSTVDALIENGAQVAIVDIDTQAGMKTAEEIKEMGGTCLFVEGNVSDAAQMEAVAARIAAHFGKIEILINNAGINTRSDRVPIHQYALEDWQRILEIDLTGVFTTSRAVIPYILDTHSKSGSENATGRIVNISSIAGLVPLRLTECLRRGESRRCQFDAFNGVGTGTGRDSGKCCCPGFDADAWYEGTLLRR